MARHVEASMLSSPQYVNFSSVGRCIHFADFHNCWQSKTLTTRPLMSRVQPNRRLQVLWLAPSKNYSEHNFYGNMTFTIDFNKLLDYFKSERMYYIDQIKFNTHMVTRILLTRQGYNYEAVNTSAAGSPIKKFGSGGGEAVWQHATSCVVGGRHLPHELEIALQPNASDQSWLFKNCTIAANNHSKANKSSYYGSYAHHVCHRFNTFGCNCPHSLDEEKGVQIVRAWVKALEENENGGRSSRDLELFGQNYKSVTGRVYDNRGSGVSHNMSFFSL